jgi:hypothetical protein
MWKSNLSKGIFIFTLFWLLSAIYSHGQEKGAVSGAPPADEKSETSSMKFTETRFEAGKVSEGTLLIHEFEFVNAGNGALRITDIVPA